MDYEKGGKQKEVFTESDVERVPCPFCSANNYSDIYKEREVLGIVKCLECDLIYVNPRLKEPEKAYWGDVKKYFEEARLIFEGKLPHHRDKNYREDLKLIQHYKPCGNFLDVGTNMGFFLRTAKKIGNWNLYGVEPSASLSDLARSYFGLNVTTAYLENAGFKSEFFDVVTLTDVFEHIVDPSRMLREIRRILRADGILFIKVPNGLFNIFKFKAMRLLGKLKDYNVFDSYEHVVHYSGLTLKKMLEKYGFDVLKLKIGSPIQLPVWHKHVGHYYQYPSPWCLDYKRKTARSLLYFLSQVEFYLSGQNIGYLAPNIIAIARKKGL